MKILRIIGRCILASVLWAVGATALFIGIQLIPRLFPWHKLGSRAEVIFMLFSIVMVAIPTILIIRMLFKKERICEAVSILVVGSLSGLFMISLIKGFGGFEYLF